MGISKAEYAWREWVLGEGEFKGKGPRSRPRPDFGYGAPGQQPVPEGWWKRLEAFLTRRHDGAEETHKPARPPENSAPTTPGMLSPHFNVREFDCHDGRRVPAIAVPALERLCESILEPLRAQFGSCQIMSGYRPADYNRRIGGAKYSQHIYELGPESVAADLIFARGTPRDWHRSADQLGAGGLGLYPTFIHVDNRAVRARWVG